MRLPMRYFHIFILMLREVKARPSKYFIYLILAIVGLFFLAYMHNYNIVFIIMFFSFALAGASGTIGRLNLYQIEARILSHEACYANLKTYYTVELYNGSDHRDSYAMEISNSFSPVEKITQLKAQEACPLKLSFLPDRRGKVELPPVKLSSYFPLPHELLYKTFKFDKTIIAYPQPKGNSLEKYAVQSQSYQGEYDDFDGLRSFEQGENLSRIFWPAYAKNQSLMAKKFTFVQASEHLHFYFERAGDTLEEKLSQLCLWCLECTKYHRTYTLHFPSTSLDSRKSSQDEILTFLALY